MEESGYTEEDMEMAQSGYVQDYTFLRVLGIIAFSIGLLSMILSFVPCLGGFMAIPSFICLVVSVIATIVFFRNKVKGKGLMLAGLIVNLIGLGVAIFQWVIINQAASPIINQY